LLDLLPPIFGTTQPVLPVHTTDAAPWRPVICNLFSPGDEIIACCNGKFGEMWAGLAESYGVVVHRIATDWERSVDPATVDAAFAEHPNAKAVAVAYADSSTGVANDFAAVARVATIAGRLDDGRRRLIDRRNAVPLR
jgi:alanine-glyoxylate transaminase/serine-glyoxylate transaminase/serine-pyruvate transaminase